MLNQQGDVNSVGIINVKILLSLALPVEIIVIQTLLYVNNTVAIGARKEVA